MTTTKTPRDPDSTIVDALRNNARRIPDQIALRRRVGYGWESITWAEYERAVAEVTAGLAELGVDPGLAVGIFSNNRVEWHLADLGTLANGSVTVPVYQTSSAEQVAHMLGNSETVLCFVENHDLAGRVLEVKDELKKLRRIVVFEDDDRLDDPFVIGFAQLRAVGAARSGARTRVVRGARGCGEARAAGDARVHERHDRAAEGRDGRPREHHVDARERDLAASTSARGNGSCRSCR